MIDLLTALILHSIAASALRAIVSRLYPEAIGHGATAFEFLGLRFCRVGLRIDWSVVISKVCQQVNQRSRGCVKFVARCVTTAAVVGSLCALSVANFVAQLPLSQQTYATAWNY